MERVLLEPRQSLLFNVDSILFSVEKNLPVATAGPIRKRPKVFQPNICHQKV